MPSQPPWIDLSQSESGWQAMFACQVCIQPFAERRKYLWGFNSAALLTEALDRQKLFIESQYHGNPLEGAFPEKRAISLRCIRLAEKGLLLALAGKVSAATRKDAREAALHYCQELTAIFPYDYTIHPAASQPTFDMLTGRVIFANCQRPQTMAQILRFETPLNTRQGTIYLHGFWQGAEHSDDQIWRALGNFPQAVMLNISLRPTRLEINERQLLWEMEQVPPAAETFPSGQPYERWAQPLLDRRMNPWKRFYLMQIHLLSPEGISESLTRPVGSAITRENDKLFSPGFSSRYPENNASAAEWIRQLSNLDLAPSQNIPTNLSRLSDVADLEEAHAVFRFPYPPEPGFPGVTFIEKIETDG